MLQAKSDVKLNLVLPKLFFYLLPEKKISLKEQALGFSNLLSISPATASPRNPPYTSFNLSLPLDSIPSSLSDRDSNRCQITHTSYYHHYWLVTDSPHPLGKLTNVTTPSDKPLSLKWMFNPNCSIKNNRNCVSWFEVKPTRKSEPKCESHCTEVEPGLTRHRLLPATATRYAEKINSRLKEMLLSGYV